MDEDDSDIIQVLPSQGLSLHFKSDDGAGGVWDKWPVIGWAVLRSQRVRPLVVSQDGDVEVEDLHRTSQPTHLCGAGFEINGRSCPLG